MSDDLLRRELEQVAVRFDRFDGALIVRIEADPGRGYNWDRLSMFGDPDDIVSFRHMTEQADRLLTELSGEYRRKQLRSPIARMLSWAWGRVQFHATLTAKQMTIMSRAAPEKLPKGTVARTAIGTAGIVAEVYRNEFDHRDDIGKMLCTAIQGYLSENPPGAVPLEKEGIKGALYQLIQVNPGIRPREMRKLLPSHFVSEGTSINNRLKEMIETGVIRKEDGAKYYVTDKPVRLT